MEEVDGIIINALREVGCYFDKGVKSVKQFQGDTVIQAVFACLKKLEPSKQLPDAIPNGMSARVSLCADLAKTIKKLGYNKGDIGYHQLLYPNENDSRNILGWLTRQLPSSEEELSAEQSQSSSKEGGDVLWKSIETSLLSLQKESWTPHFSISSDNRRNYGHVHNLHTQHVQNPFVLPSQVPSRAAAQEAREYIKSNVDFVTRQPARRVDVIPSILETNFSAFTADKEREEEWNAEGLDSGLNPVQFRNRKKGKILQEMSSHIRYTLDESEAIFQKSYVADSDNARAQRQSNMSRYANLVEYTQEETVPVQQESEEDVKKRREEEITALEGQLTSVKQKIEFIRNEMESFHTRMRQVDANLLAEDEKFKSLEEDYTVKKKIMEMLPNADFHIAALKEQIQQLARNIKSLATEWEKKRPVLIETYRKNRYDILNRDDGSAGLLDEIRSMRVQIKEIDGEIRKKDEEYKEYLDQYAQMPRNVNRSQYTRRILDIVKQVKKQKVEINKILIDTRALQKEINTNIDSLGRIFALTTELVFADAKRDAAAKETYRGIVAMHDKFKELSDIISEIGNNSNAVLDLEERHQQLKVRAGPLDVNQITNDLEAIRQENAQLLAQLKAKQDA